MTTSQLGRTKLVTWPNLNDPAGSGQVTTIQLAVAEMSDNSPARIQESSAIADGVTVELDHNMGINLDQLTVLIYSGTHPNMTRIQDPEGIAVPWAIAEKTSFEKLVLEITAPASGGPHTFTVIVLNDVMKDYKTTIDSRAVSSNITLSDKILYRVDTSALRSLALPPASEKLYIELKDVTGLAASNNVTLTTPGAETIDGEATFIANSNYFSLAIISDGTNYFVMLSGGGAGGGGGAGLTWSDGTGSPPILSQEYGETVYLFESGLTQTLQVYLKVPSSYGSGKQINMRLSHYSPSAVNTVLLSTTASLIRAGTDPITSVTNQHSSTNAAVTNDQADEYTEIVCDLTDGSGAVNSVPVSAGDIIKVELVRGTDTDTADVRFIPSATEATFS